MKYLFKILMLLEFILVSTFVMAQDPDNTATFVGNVKAFDPDSGQTLIYRIVAGDPDNFFSIDPRNGALRVSQSAYSTFVRKRTWKLTVAVADNDEKNPLTSKATITVILKKDNRDKIGDSKIADLK